ncbi:MAG: haloalkane dehalogenase [Acidimicrobiia bacterium]|nr:haloalkane dehalogenase [Acidimicrobiia bacterium]
MTTPPTAAFPFAKKTATVHGRTMAYVDEGRGLPILFLHGNPTSSYLWRNVLPHVAELGRGIAPDLIGMGDSDPLDDTGPEAYTFVQHRDHLDGLLDHLRLAEMGGVVLVVHDWGSALGFDWAYRHPDAVAGIAYMEAIVRPLTWDEWPAPARPIFEAFRSPYGEEMILERNLFIERVLPGSVLRELTDEELDHYRRPFTTPQRRRPILTWPRQIPIDGEPLEVHQIVADYARWLSNVPIPKLLIRAEPGAILNGPQLDFCRRWPNQTEVTVTGGHFCPEDSPDEIGTAIADWIIEQLQD